MKLEKLKEILEEKEYAVELVKVNNAKTKQDRLYLKINSSFKIHFAEFEDSLFMYVFINHPKGFDYTNYKQTDDEKARCRTAKFNALNLLYEERIEGLEDYETEEAVLLSPKSGKKKFDL
jgi:hypothetical protein